LSNKNEDFDEDRIKFKNAYGRACKNLSACIVSLNEMYSLGDSMNLTHDVGNIIEKCEEVMNYLFNMNRYIK